MTRAHLGSGSLRLPLTLTSSDWQGGGALVYPSQPVNWAGLGSTMSIWAYVSASAPSGLEISLFIQHPTWDWLESEWVPLVPGQWVEVRWPGAPLTNLAAVGVQVGSNGIRYTGNVFIDQLTVR